MVLARVPRKNEPAIVLGSKVNRPPHLNLFRKPKVRVRFWYVPQMRLPDPNWEPPRPALISSYEKAMSDLRMVIGVGAYVISDEVAKILAQLEPPPAIGHYFDTLTADTEVYAKALAKIRELAKRDLKVR